MGGPVIVAFMGAALCYVRADMGGPLVHIDEHGAVSACGAAERRAVGMRDGHRRGAAEYRIV